MKLLVDMQFYAPLIRRRQATLFLTDWLNLILKLGLYYTEAKAQITVESVVGKRNNVWSSKSETCA